MPERWVNFHGFVLFVDRTTKREVYRLDPIDPYLADRRWDGILIRDRCWVLATSEDNARGVVHETCLWNLERPPDYTPWLDPELSSCVLDASRKVGLGTVHAAGYCYWG